MQLLTLLFNVLLALNVLGAPIRRETNGERMRKGLPPREPPRITAARKQRPLIVPLADSSFTNGGFEDAFLSEDTHAYTSPGWDVTDIRKDRSLAHTGDYYALLSQSISQGTSHFLNDLDTTREYTINLWYALQRTDTTEADLCTLYIHLNGQIVGWAFPSIDEGVSRTAYSLLSVTIAPMAPTSRLLIDGLNCEGWASMKDTSFLIDDITIT